MKITEIAKVSAREILDSRGNPTVEATVILGGGAIGVAAVPSGASTGTHEAIELRDGGKRYGGKGVLRAVKNVNTEIAAALKGKNVLEQQKVDEIMIHLDGTKNKSRLGTNAILAVSLAACRAAAESVEKPLYCYIREIFSLKEKKWRLPIPTINILNGGRHADNNLSIQEFMIVPVAKKFSERVRMGSQIFHTLGQLLGKKRLSTGVGDEGGYAPDLLNNEQALKFICEAVTQAGFVLGKEVYLAMDVAASEFHHSGKYYFLDQKHAWTAEKMIRNLESWLKKYPLVSVEDPLAEDDWANWKELTARVGGKLALVGDDLFVTNVERIEQGVKNKAANAVLIKLNQIGTLSETISAIQLARKNGYKISVSHRSGETADTFIADLAVAVGAEFIKTGSMSRSERVEKYNRLMKIEEDLND